MSVILRNAQGRLLFFTVCICVLWPFYPVEAAEKQGVKQRIEKIEEIEKEKEGIDVRPAVLTPFIDKATLSGFVEFNYDYTDVSDTEDEDSGSTSDSYISSVELALRIFFNEWAKTKIVVNAEDIGMNGGNGKINLDEAILTLKCPWIPLYFIGGKTALPFGVFEDRMISGTLTEELYEIDDIGATVGFAPDYFGLDISLSVYEGQDVIENLEDFGTHEFSPGRNKENDVDSFIASIALEPIEELFTVAAFYNNEPGDGNRNQSLGGAFTFNVWKLILDAEYITALEREKGENGEQNKESAWFAALAFQPIEDLELATRYESFNDDRRGDQDEVVDYRYLAGFNYSFFDFATFSFEYRHTKFEKEEGSNAADEQNEFFFQLALEF